MKKADFDRMADEFQFLTVDARQEPQAIQRQLAFRGTRGIPDMWDGRAGARVVGILAEQLMAHTTVMPDLQPETGQIQENTR